MGLRFVAVVLPAFDPIDGYAKRFNFGWRSEWLPTKAKLRLVLFVLPNVAYAGVAAGPPFSLEQNNGRS